MKTNQSVKLIPKELLENIPELYFFNDKDILNNYQENIKKYSERARKTLDVFSYDKGKVKGSNPFAVIELSKLVQIATPSQLEQAVRNAPNFFKKSYEDIAFLLQTKRDSDVTNDYLAKELFNQLKKRKIKLPARISLKGLALKEDNNSAYGLVPVITDETELFHSPEFSYKNNERKFSITDENGVPIWDKNGVRTFYTRKGLSRLSLYWFLNLYSDDDDLALSDSDGRVALVSGEATSQKILELNSQKKYSEIQIEDVVRMYLNKNLNVTKVSKEILKYLEGKK